MPLTSELWSQPAVPFLDPDSGDKIKLCLRTMSFEREIQFLPADILKVHQVIIEQRAKRNESIYMMVAAWNKLRVYDRFWTSLGFATEEEYLVYYSLPDGMTLAGWTVMVKLFDKATFILLGDTILNFMMRSIERHQKDLDERKRDYQAIFESYCKAHDGLDRNAFYHTVGSYLRSKYERPLAIAAGTSVQIWKKDQYRVRPGVVKQRKVVPVSPEIKQQFGPRVTSDFAWEERECSHCRSKASVIELQREYIAKLEQVIVEKLGEHALPEKPTGM